MRLRYGFRPRFKMIHNPKGVVVYHAFKICTFG